VVQVERYHAGLAGEWDAFVHGCRNGVFLFLRGYMDYHADRFTDHSLLFRADGRLVAVLPASRHPGQLSSHGGLTFGGVLSPPRMGTPLMLEVFDALRAHLRDLGIPRLLYKAVPPIYHDVPAEEDLYALFRAGARLVRRDVSSTVRMDARVPVAKGRKSSVGVARRNGVQVRRSDDFAAFMAIETEVLSRRHGVRPVHSAEEMAMLAARFPENVKLFAGYQGDEMLGGTVVYESRQVAHAQYIASTDRGRELCAMDLVMDHLLGTEYAGKRWFDFGISTEQGGQVLNAGLVSNKESYGARATVYDFYELDADG
jgi:hypothetical protein